MDLVVEKIKRNKHFFWGLKGIACLLIMYIIFSNFFVDGINAYYSYRDYNYQNDFAEASFCVGATEVRQKFTAKGNILSNIKAYFGEITDTELAIEIIGDNDRVIAFKVVNEISYNANAWNTISFNCFKLTRGKEYTIRVSGSDLSAIAVNASNTYPAVFGACMLNGSQIQGSLAIGIQDTYAYMTLGSLLELSVTLLFLIILTGALCYTIINIEKIFAVYKSTEKKKGLLYSLYFSLYTTLFFNPLEAIRNEVTEFNRVIGAGINLGVDVSKRTSNFNHWFICLAVTFSLFFLLANYLKSKQLSEESSKAVRFLDCIVVIANVNIVFRCITYFYNQQQETKPFIYSDYIIMLVLLLALAFIVLELDKRINMDTFMKIVLSGMMIAYPISILITQEWNDGRVLMGIQVIISVFALIFIRMTKIDWENRSISIVITTAVVTFSLIPFCTSLYIEMISILNQHKVFVTAIRRNYLFAIVAGLLITGMIVVILYKKNLYIKSWRRYAYPSIIFGISCLWCQIPVSGTYNADIFESANISILISDFLNFGSIPIVEHYGGHMMTGVWEGIIYGLLNNDFSGAIFTPYSGYLAAVLAILFYYLVKYIWDEDAALFVALFFPFYDAWSYWGLGMLMCLGAMAFVKKNTYPRAILFWLTFIWCTIYRLDLGFAFAIACMLALTIYIVATKNLKALKQLSITLMGCGIIGAVAWFVICFAKHINPINRLLEFLLINLSNQNWAYDNIGNTSLTMFSWTYIFIPFAVVLCLLYAVLSKKLRENMSNANWILLLILGLSYVFNFSRGLVRHSLVEIALSVIMWSAYLFLTVFLVSLKSNGKYFCPIFAGFILCNSLFLTGNNFTDNSIADVAVGKIGTYTESWSLSRFSQVELPEGETAKTYWMDIKEKGEVIQRVVWDEALKSTVEDYQIMINALLEDDETFVDFINKTFIYSAINRKNPVYVSQSPLQISGEFTQQQFINEIENIPLVLMPFDNSNYYLSEALDGISNFYRYYKVSEYIYQNYIPLCTYEDKYALWCLPERYDEMVAKVLELNTNSEVELNGALINGLANLVFHSTEIVANSDGSININCTGVDPIVSEIQNVFDITPYIGKSLEIVIDYETNVDAEMQIFYTTEAGEEYTEEKAETVITNGKNTAHFNIPITKYTRLRLDTPEGSNVKILSFKINASKASLVDYGYDGPYLSEDGVNYGFLPSIHSYSLYKLPIIWAEEDKMDSSNNAIITELIYSEGVYKYDLSTAELGDDGNYLKASIEFNGYDQLGKYRNDDETSIARIKLGNYANGKFDTKYVYDFTIEEGKHEYMFRVSSDYYWYLKQTNAVILECGDQLLNVKMEFLEGD